MLLTVEPTAGFVHFFQILSWIVLPVLLSTVLVTSLLHYRRKKKRTAKNNEEEDVLLRASPEQLGYTRGDGEYVFFDHSRLIQEYKHRLSLNHARYTALRKDFSDMENKYRALKSSAQTRSFTANNTIMEHLQEQVPSPMEITAVKTGEEYAAEKKELLERLEQLNSSYESLEQENKSLQDQLQMTIATDEERNERIKRWSDENALLRDRIAEQEYLEDILGEKNAEISFLQSQLEQRVKNQHQAERQREQLVSEVERLEKENQENVLQVESLKNGLLVMQKEAGKLQAALGRQEEQLAENQQLVNAKQDHIVYLENMFGETRQQNELLQAELADKRDMINLLQQQLEEGEAALQSMEQKLRSQKQIMQRLYKEFAACLEEEKEMPPVVQLNPGYRGQGNEGVVVQ